MTGGLLQPYIGYLVPHLSIYRYDRQDRRSGMLTTKPTLQREGSLVDRLCDAQNNCLLHAQPVLDRHKTVAGQIVRSPFLRHNGVSSDD